MIVGAPDVVTQQDLANPVEGDPDPDVASDLPYACDVAYSRDIAAFVGPTRVVGRLPDINGARGSADASHLVRLLRTASRYRVRDAVAYERYFALSAFTWEQSTRRTLFEIFGERDCRTSPPSGPRFAASALLPLAHFINCHGSEASPAFQGQFGRRDYPVALTTRSVDGLVQEGTVAAAECCYGAQMYEARTLDLDLPIAQSYLFQGAYGWLGSSTIAYGPARTNGAADIVTRYFMLAVLDGASLGSALLAARQRYVADANELDPIDLKTLAQFTLLGDPAIHPVRAATPTRLPKTVGEAQSVRLLRRSRRAKLEVAGRLLLRSKPTASCAQSVRRVPARVKNALDAIARESGVDAGAFRAYPVDVPDVSRIGAAKAAPFASRYFVAVCHRARTPHPLDLVAVVAKEVSGRIVAYRVYDRR